MRVHQQPGCVLHARDYSETSLTLEVFTARYGRLGLLAKGARRPSSRVRGMLEPFQPLLLSWTGRGELPILTGAEPDGETPLLSGDTLYCGFYLNELLVRLLHRHDPHEALYLAYRQALTALGSSENSEMALREFERRLLGEIGYGLVLDRDVMDNSAIDANAWYDYVPERGPVRTSYAEHNRSQGIVVRGASLIALAQSDLHQPETLREVKRLMRAILARYLGDKPLHSRKLFHGIAARAAHPAAVADKAEQ
jgi:DNA repair protein RecO (recombination protein O)